MEEVEAAQVVMIAKGVWTIKRAVDDCSITMIPTCDTSRRGTQ